MKTRFVLALLTLAAFSLHAADHPAYVTVPLEQAGGKALESYGEASAWSTVPTGDQTFGGVPFKLTTKLQLHGNQDAKENRFYHARVMGLPVGHNLTKLHILHGANISEKSPRPIASVRVNYAGGSNYTFFISYGVQVRNFWKDGTGKDSVTDSNSALVWTGGAAPADQAGTTHRLYKSAFDLPAGRPVVESLDLFSTFGTSSEVVLAITGEDSARPATQVPPSEDDSKYRESITVKIANHKNNPILGAHMRGTATPIPRAGLGGGVSTTLGRMDDASAEIGVVVVDFPAGANRLNLSAQAAKFVPQDIALVRGTNGQFPSETSVRLAPGVEIGGLVRDPSGQPLPKAKVEIYRTWPLYGLIRTDDILTDAEGRWKTDEAPESLSSLRFQVTHASFHRGAYELFGEQGEGGLTRAALLGDKAEFQLERKLDLTGTVRDEAGRPLTNVTVWLMRNGGGGGNRTDRRGAFTLKDVDRAPGWLKVEDPAFAPLVLPIDPARDKGPFKLVVGPGTPLRGQFVERVGTNSTEMRPVSGLTVNITTSNNMVQWYGKADTNGYFEWPHAPAGALVVNAYVPARGSRRFTVRADQAETKFDLSPTFTWRAVVRDEETQEAVANCTATPGHPISEGRWGWMGYDSKPGRTGEVTFTDQNNPTVLKVEAPGYQPRIFPMPERSGPASDVFVLRRSVAVKGVVKLPDGSPASGAQVALAGEIHLALGQGTFSGFGQSPAERALTATTDGQGRFELPPHYAPRVIVVHPAGYAETTSSNLATRAEVKLEPFGTIEGVLLEGREPVPGATVQIDPVYLGALSLDTNFTARTDEQGRFVFTHVPPGTRWLARKVEKLPQNFVWSHRTPVEVAPGATVQAKIGGTGRVVIGRLAVPSGTTIDWQRSTFSVVTMTRTPSFRTTEEQRAWQATPEGRESMTVRSYAMLATPDGRLRAADVPPGRHRIQMNLRAPPAPGAGANSYGVYIPAPGRDFEIGPLPGGRGDEPLDLGEIEVNAGR